MSDAQEVKLRAWMFGFSTLKCGQFIFRNFVIACFNVQNQKLAAMLVFDLCANLLVVKLLSALCKGFCGYCHSFSPKQKSAELPRRSDWL